MDEHTCINEERLTKLEIYAQHRRERLEEIEKRLKSLDANLTDLCMNLAEINSMLSTLKWIIGVFITLFSGIICFMVTGLMHIL